MLGMKERETVLPIQEIEIRTKNGRAFHKKSLQRTGFAGR